jgi:hypothetical protein
MKLIQFLWAFIAPIMLHADDDSGGGGGTLLSGDAGGAGDGGDAGASDGAGDAGSSGEPSYSMLNVFKDGQILPEAAKQFGEDKGLHSFFGKYAKAEDPNKAVLDGIKNLQYLAGTKGLEPLPDDAPDSVKEERAEIMRKANGVPATPADYGIVKPDDMPDEQWNGEYVNDMVSVLHKYNAPPAMVNELFEMDGQHAAKLGAETEAAQAAAMKAESAKLTEAFGSEIQEKTDHAKRMARTLGLDPATDPMFNSANVVKAFAQMFTMVSEDRIVSGDGGNNLGSSDREKAKDIIFNKANPLNAAYHDPDDPRHKQAVDQVTAFNKRAVSKS